jgi:hypothetical protein
MRGSGGKARNKVSLRNKSSPSRRNSRISQLALDEGEFLETVVPVRAFATLTTLRRCAQERLLDFFQRWVRALQRHQRLTLGWIRALESRPHRHIHVALVSSVPLDCAFAGLLWREIAAPRYANAAEVRPYLRGRCGLGYVLKTLDACYEDAEFSSNLTAFALFSSASRTNSAQRRQRRRIQVQLRAIKGFVR